MHKEAKQFFKLANPTDADWLTLCSNSQREEMLLCYEQYQQQLIRLKAIKDNKAEISSQFKHHKDDADQLAALKQTMKSVSAEYSHQEQQLKDKVDAVAAMLQTLQEQQQDRQPLALQAPKKRLNRPLTFTRVNIDDSDFMAFQEQHASGLNCGQRHTVLRSIEEAFGYCTTVLLAYADEKIVGALPLTEIHSPIFGHTLTSTPYMNYGGPLTVYLDVSEQLIRNSCSAVAESNMKPPKVEVRTMTPDLPLPCSMKKVSMVLRLPDNLDTYRKNLGTKLRAQINKAYEHSPEIRFGKQELLDDFYRVFSINMRDLGTPVYSKSWFRQLLINDPLRCTLVVGYLNDKAVSCGFLMAAEDMLEIPWASTVKSANPKNINLFMYDHILRFAIKQGFDFFDFGRSTKGASTYRFKKQWGAQPLSHYWYYLNEHDVSDGANPDNPKYRLMIAIWKKLPLWVAGLIGPKIVKQIP